MGLLLCTSLLELPMTDCAVPFKGILKEREKYTEARQQIVKHLDGMGYVCWIMTIFLTNVGHHDPQTAI